MRYVCLEDDKVVSILEYEPEVPQNITVFTISDQQYSDLTNGLSYVNTATKTIDSYPQEFMQEEEVKRNNGLEREFLNSTDWMILRHLRQKTLGIETTLTEAEYVNLEQRRHDSASRIVQINKGN